ncbi:transposase [Streptomyces sp. NPDC014623]|uniref:transposase n=1 Tax=Streptomyces sp. NPDC014623 TaxID=3364875 RepID=UPI003700BA85
MAEPLQHPTPTLPPRTTITDRLREHPPPHTNYADTSRITHVQDSGSRPSRNLRSKPQPVGPRPPSARAVTRWILTRPEALTERDRIQLKDVLANCPELDALAGHIRSFAHMLTQLQGHQLPAWIEAATTTDLPSLQRFARHLERDLDAVTAGLSQPWNSGVVEGHVNRIKILKRQMFGRAGFELLRERVLLYS